MWPVWKKICNYFWTFSVRIQKWTNNFIFFVGRFPGIRWKTEKKILRNFSLYSTDITWKYFNFFQSNCLDPRWIDIVAFRLCNNNKNNYNASKDFAESKLFNASPRTKFIIKINHNDIMIIIIINIIMIILMILYHKFESQTYAM